MNTYPRGAALLRAAKTHCDHGHDIRDARRDKEGRRVCAECKKLWKRKNRADYRAYYAALVNK